MNKGKEIYKIYAPDGTKWIEWVRPVPFVAIDTYKRMPVVGWNDKKIVFLNNKYQNNIALFVDFPGKEAIEFGIGLANLGYRPIPLFNGTDEQQNSQATTDTYLVECSLINGAEKLKTIELDKNANPAFLLDSSRINRYRANETIFDNSWDIYYQDVPTADYLKQNNINEIIVVSKEIKKDLKKILLKYQKEGIDIYLTDGYRKCQRKILRKTLRERFEKEEI